MPPVTAARWSTFEHLRAQCARFPALAFVGPPDKGLSSRDAALTHAICDAVARRWLTIDAVVSRSLKRPLSLAPVGAQAALLAGAAQLLFFDRIPDHAAISQSVLYARYRARASAGMVNAVLRGLARLIDREADDAGPWTLEDRSAIPRADGRVLRFKEPVLPEEPMTRLQAATGCPKALLEEWSGAFGQERSVELALHTVVEPPVVFNTKYAKEPLPVGLVPHRCVGSHVWHGAGSALVDISATRRDIWVQDVASARAVPFARALLPASGDGLLVDLCAGQGTKTRQLLAEFPGARIIATDTDPRRFSVLKQVFEAEERVRVVPASHVGSEAAGAALVLADVPCSNSAVLPRRPEAKYRWGRKQHKRLVQTQREIIEHAQALLAPGGLLVYSTCSLDHAENEQQRDYAVSLGMSLAAEERVMPSGLPGDPPTQYRDGAYVAVLRRA